MKMLTVENVTKTYGEKQLFNNISITIGEKERVGLIGINGTGKSSLLKIIAGLDQPDDGKIITGKDYSIAFLDQQPELDSAKTVLEQVFHGEAPILRLMREYEKTLLLLNSSPNDTKVQEDLFQLQKQMDALNAWDASTNAKSILMKLGIEDFTKKIGELSGGQKKRVALAQVLIAEPDLLILDEPTNHLDFDSVKWLEEYLSRYSGSILLVTHDRYFLDRVANRMFELDGGNLYSYKGNYAAFLEAKAIREENEAATFEKRQNLFRRELEWMRRGAKARTTKQKARIQRFDELEDKLSGGKPTGEKVDISLNGSRLGKQVFELKDASMRYGSKTILNHFNLLVKPGDRLGIIGRNGAGKSTLLNILAKKLPLDEGEFIMGQTVKIAYYTQENEDMDENKRMIEYIKETAEVVETSDGKTLSAALMLERFLFPPFSHGTPIRKLSGGEKRRLYLLKLLMTAPNVLLLDEPTNDLDTQTLTVLEDYLEDFPGVVITVSHDRYFLDKVVDQLLVLRGEGQIDSFYGNYSEHLEKESAAVEVKKPVATTTKTPEKEKKKRMTFKEKKEWEEIDEVIEKTEARLEEIANEMGNTGSDFTKAQELMKLEAELNEKLEYLIERWEYLAELAESE
ncbi:ABC-F family ATP-binding cassette domain-containing protein [Neobacillus sp. 3P2-tot-E-2]|uniref:ABC-F family ATP-binding cassette domain-containing protein n=1 Tax=Neobacillus sp. 3P2-tot-E-2 TaxID=3132212 RepID=UPI00399EF854